MQTKRNVFLWALYDFANSLVSIVFFLYFAQWMVIERGFSDFAFNLTFVVSAALLLCTAPLAGSLIDGSLRKITGLRYATIGTALFYSLSAWGAITQHDMVAVIAFTFGLYWYLLAFTFYTPLLGDIAAPGRRGFVSGVGITANYIGQFTGLLIALPFATGSLNLFGATARAETLLPAIIAFVVFSLPMLLFFVEPAPRVGKKTLAAHAQDTARKTRVLFRSSSVLFFFLAYFFYNDAVLTAANNFPIFLEQVWSVPDTTKTAILLGILVTSAIGGTLSGLIADRFGHKRTLTGVLCGWVVLLPLLALVRNFTLFVVIAGLMGFWLGASWTVSRSLLSHLAPKGQRGLAFTYFGLSERAASFVGPLSWGLIVSGFVGMGTDRYRVAALAMTVFVILGIVALTRVRTRR